MEKRLGRYKVFVDVWNDCDDYEDTLVTLDFVTIATTATEARDFITTELEAGVYDDDIDERRCEVQEASEKHRMEDLDEKELLAKVQKVNEIADHWNKVCSYNMERNAEFVFEVIDVIYGDTFNLDDQRYFISDLEKMSRIWKLLNGKEISYMAIPKIEEILYM